MKPFKYCPVCKSELQVEERGDRDRLCCLDESCGFVHWDNPKPVVAAIIEYKDQILLVRNVGWPEKWYGLLTGFLEREETPEEAILREIKEEVDLNGEVIEHVGIYPFAQMNEIIIAFYVTASGTITLNDELENYKLVEKSKLRPWPFGTGKAVRDWIKKHLKKDD